VGTPLSPPLLLLPPPLLLLPLLLLPLLLLLLLPLLPLLPLLLLPPAHDACGIPAFTQLSNAATCAAEGAALPTGGMGETVLVIRVTQTCPTDFVRSLMAGATKFA